MRNSRADIDEFLSAKRIVVAGVSRKPEDFSRTLFREFLHRGYEAIPVHPEAESIEDIRVRRRIDEVHPAPENLLIMLPPDEALGVVREAIEAGVRRIWLYGGATAGSASPKAIDLCDRAGVACIASECPFMYLPNSGWIHGVHRFFKILTGSMPR